MTQVVPSRGPILRTQVVMKSQKLVVQNAGMKPMHDAQHRHHEAFGRGSPQERGFEKFAVRGVGQVVGVIHAKGPPGSRSGIGRADRAAKNSDSTAGSPGLVDFPEASPFAERVSSPAVTTRTPA